MRSFIGVVGQEPVLFATTIRENIRYGNPECTDEETETAARIANCHGFIMKLPNEYDTLIGERGASLSGGQKQRIAIARAIVRNPKILLLDEATSALDPSSEKRVQDALEKASRGRTTVVVSHRLSTVVNSDKIVIINSGKVVEQGTHSELMEMRGKYFDLVNANKDTEEESEQDSKLRKRRDSKLKRRESVMSDIQVESSDEESDTDSDSEEKLKEVEDEVEVSNYRLLKMNSKEWPFITMGCLSAIVVGASYPAFAILFGEVYGILSLSDSAEIQSNANMLSIYSVVLGVVTGGAMFLQTFMFSIAGVKLTSRLRSMTFKAMMDQEMAWFDNSKNAVGALCARLAGDCASVQGATGTRIGSFLQSGSVIFIGLGISFYFNWKMTLVASVSIPLVLFFVFMETR